MDNKIEKLVVLVDGGIKEKWKAPQACHAALEWQIKNGKGWKNETLVLLEVKSGRELKKYYSHLIENGMNPVNFREPAWNFRFTAFAVLSDNEELFNGLNLLSPKVT